MPTSQTEESTTEVGQSGNWITPSNGVMITILILVAACLGVAFRDFFLLQYHYATVEAADWGHTLFIPLIALYVVLLHKADLFEGPIIPSKFGFLLVIGGILWYAATWLTPDSTFLNSHNIRAVGVFLAILGVTIGLLGWRSLIWLWFPLLYIFVFGQRITDKVLLEITLPMQSIAAWGSWHALEFLGYELLPSRQSHRGAPAGRRRVSTRCRGSLFGDANAHGVSRPRHRHRLRRTGSLATPTHPDRLGNSDRDLHQRPSNLHARNSRHERGRVHVR
jgi:hypothetical protein